MNLKIIGGGIAGLASALAISNAGGAATIFEKTPEFETLGAGLQIGPNAARALQHLGAWEAVKPLTFSPPEIHIRNGKNGKILKRLALGAAFEARYGMPYRTAHRADLHHGLLQAVRERANIEIVMGEDIASTDTAGFDGVVAADGVWSKMRQDLFPQSRVIKTKHMFFRNLLDLPAIRGDIDFSCVNLWLFPGGHVVHYPVGNPARLNLVAITTGETPQEFFVKAQDGLREILAFAPNPTQWPSAFISHLPAWSKRNVALIGDAAHATLPYLAQGAAMALEDAAVLQKYILHFPAVADAFEKYYRERHDRVQKLHVQTMRQGQIYHLSGIMNAARDATLSLVPRALMMNGLNWIYDWKVV
jgi:salicylate hydroxylase